MTPSSSEYLAMAIGTAIAGGGDHQFEATSTSQYGNVIEQWAIVVIPGTFYWSARSLGSGKIQSFDPNTLSLYDGDESIQLSLDRIPSSFPEPVKLAFRSLFRFGAGTVMSTIRYRWRIRTTTPYSCFVTRKTKAFSGPLLSTVKLGEQSDSSRPRSFYTKT